MKTTDLGICEREALVFFSSHPVSRAYGTEWFDSDSVYEATRADLKLSCAIHPIHRDVRLILSCGENVIFEWNAQGLDDICYIEEKNRTILKFISSDQDYTTLQVEPEIAISRQSKEPDPEEIAE